MSDHRRRATRWLVLAGAAMFSLLLALLWALVTHQREAAADERAVSGPMRRLGRIGDEVAVVLDSAALRHARIETRSLQMGTTAGAVRLVGGLIADPARVTSIRAGLPGRLASAGSRWPSLGEAVRAGTVLGQVSDAHSLTAPRGGIVTRVGAQPGEIVQAGQELLQLTDFTAPIARIVWVPTAPTPPSVVHIAPLGGPLTLSSPAHLIGPAADVDSLTRRPVYLYRVVHTWPGARAGTAVVASVTRSSETAEGLLVPVTAVVQWQGLAWAFVERTPGHFVRVRIDTSHPVPGGWIVPMVHHARDGRVLSGDTVGGLGGEAEALALAPDDRVVVRGAAQLLSEEFRSRIPEDESEGS